MRPFHAFAFVLTMSIMTGCASPPTAPASRIEPVAPHAVLLDVPPGEYREFSGKLEIPAVAAFTGMRVVTKAHRLQASEQWRPTIIFCVKQKQTGAAYCLNTYATKNGDRFVAKLLSKESEAAAVVTTPLPFDLAPTDSHFIDIAFLRDRIVMIVDDTEFFDHPLAMPLDEYWYSCSSIVCSVDGLYPYTPPANPS